MREREIDCEIKQKQPYGYQLLLNGVDVAPYVSEFSYRIKGCGVPEITLRIPVRSLKSECKALLEMVGIDDEAG